MHRQKRKAAGLCLIFVILVFAVIALALLPITDTEKGAGHTADAEQAAGTDSGDKLLRSDEEAEISELAITGESCDYVIVKEEEGYSIPNFPKGRLDSSKVEGALDHLMQAEVTEWLGEQSDLGQFGLESEGTVVTAAWTNGEEQTFRIGDGLSGREDERYVLCGGEVAVVKGFPGELTEGRGAFYDLNLISVATAADVGGENVDELEYLRLEGSRFAERVGIVRSGQTSSGYLMEEPVYGEAMFAATDTVTREVSILDSLAYVTAISVVREDAGEEAVSQCGLTEPYAIADYSMNGEHHTIRVSNVQDDVRYMMVDDDANIYQVEDIRVSAWAEADPGRLRTSYIWLVDVGELACLTITDGEKTREFRIGQETEADADWLLFYQELLGMTILNTERPSAWEEEASYTIVYQYAEEDKAPVTIELFQEKDRGRYAAFLDGSFAGVLRADTVDETMKMADRMSADEENP